MLISMQLTEEDMSFPENSCWGFHKGLPFEAIGGVVRATLTVLMNSSSLKI
jgi:hypothetical protein